jgi:hypothetical protein
MNELGLWGSGRNGSPASGIPSTRFYRYLVRDKTIDQSSQVWAADVAQIPMQQGYLYLVAIID